MVMIVASPSAFNTVYQICMLGMISLWWDGEVQLPFVKIEVEGEVEMVFSGAILTNYDFQYNPITRPLFTLPNPREQGYTMHFTLPDVPDYDTMYYHLDQNGVSLLIDRLIIRQNDTLLSLSCSFHTIALSDGRKYTITRYNIHE